jgi:hypothetical protein
VLIDGVSSPSYVSVQDRSQHHGGQTVPHATITEGIRVAETTSKTRPKQDPRPRTGSSASEAPCERSPVKRGFTKFLHSQNLSSRASPVETGEPVRKTYAEPSALDTGSLDPVVVRELVREEHATK